MKGFAWGAVLGVAGFGLWARWYLGDAVHRHAPIIKERVW